MMTYSETLDYLFQQLPMYHRIGAAAFKKDLTNTLALCAHLGNPQHKFMSIHIAGTNGKGTTSHLLAATLQEAGYKVGLYTSPHYKDFRERIKINGAFITEQYVVDFVANNKVAFEEIEPSFFEMTVAMAFDYFAVNQVDIAVIEVGLGGRLDSTNVITPLMSVITNISFDHMAMLGNTLPEIAFEKAGIIKPNIPVVIGETQPESSPVFIKKGTAENAPITFADQQYIVEYQKDGFAFVQKVDNKESLEKYYLDGGLGRIQYQEKNLVTVLQSIEVLAQNTAFKVNPSHLQAALMDLQGKVRYMGRWQQLGNQPLIIADSGHNEAGVLAAIAQLKTMTYQHLHLVTGFVNDKDVSNVLALYPKAATYYFAKANIPRGLDATVLQQLAQEKGLNGHAYASVPLAFEAAKQAAAKDDLVLVLGSIFVVAEVL